MKPLSEERTEERGIAVWVRSRPPTWLEKVIITWPHRRILDKMFEVVTFGC